MNTNHSHAHTLPTAEAQVGGACSLSERVGNGLRTHSGDARLPAADAASRKVRFVGYFTLAVVFESQVVIWGEHDTATAVVADVDPRRTYRLR
jgi:hypothetical protein